MFGNGLPEEELEAQLQTPSSHPFQKYKITEIQKYRDTNAIVLLEGGLKTRFKHNLVIFSTNTEMLKTGTSWLNFV